MALPPLSIDAERALRSIAVPPNVELVTLGLVEVDRNGLARLTMRGALKLLEIIGSDDLALACACGHRKGDHHVDPPLPCMVGAARGVRGRVVPMPCPCKGFRSPEPEPTTGGAG